MPNVAADIRLMLAGGFGEPVTLSTGAIVRANASTATADDSLGGDGIIAGHTLVLTLATADIPGVKARTTLTFRGKAYGVNHVMLRAQGNLTRLFLGAP
jgi:hypothetical protein